MKAIVIGGTGFIGRHIVNSLISSGIHVRALTREKQNKALPFPKAVEVRSGNILDIHSIRKHIKDVDLIYSTFGILGQWNIPEKTYWAINFRAVKNLLESSLNCNLKQFIHISSAGVLGPLLDGVVADESFPFNPSNIYEKTKCAAEKEILIYGKKFGVPFTIIRPEFVYGPGDLHVLNLFKAIRSKRFIIIGKGDSLLHPTYIEDLIQGINRCTGNEKAVGEIFLITGNRPLPVKKLVTIIAEESHVRLPTIKIPLPLAKTAAIVMELSAKLLNFEPPLTRSRIKYFSENRAFSCQKARTDLGYTPLVDFREGVRRTLRWYIDNAYL